MTHSPEDCLHKTLSDWSLWGFTSTCPALDEQSLTPYQASLNTPHFSLCAWPEFDAHRIIKAPHQGLSNHNYLFYADGERWLLRIHKQHDTSLGVNRAREAAIQSHMAKAGLALGIHYTDPEHRYWVRPWVDGITASECLQSGQGLTEAQVEALLDTLYLLHTFRHKHHQWTKALPKFSISQHYEYYRQQLPPSAELDALTQRFNHATHTIKQHRQQKKTLCHIDPHLGNMLFTTNGQALLLDWEYAAVHRPEWDWAQLYLSLNEWVQANGHLSTSNPIHYLIHTAYSLTTDAHIEQADCTNQSWQMLVNTK